MTPAGSLGQDHVVYMLGQIDSKLDGIGETLRGHSDRLTGAERGIVDGKVAQALVATHTTRIEALERDAIRTKIVMALMAAVAFGKDHVGHLIALATAH